MVTIKGTAGFTDGEKVRVNGQKLLKGLKCLFTEHEFEKCTIVSNGKTMQGKLCTNCHLFVNLYGDL